MSMDKPARPRIDFLIEFTRGGHLTVNWQPTGLVNDSIGPDCDWIDWLPPKAQREADPYNRLIVIRALQTAQKALDYQVKECGNKKARLSPLERNVLQHIRTVDGILLRAAEALVNSTRHRLERSFDVHLINDIFTEWESVRNEADPYDIADRLLMWEVENTNDKTID